MAGKGAEGGGSAKSLATPWGGVARKKRAKKLYFVDVYLAPDVSEGRRVAFSMGLHDRVIPLL